MPVPYSHLTTHATNPSAPPFIHVRTPSSSGAPNHPLNLPGWNNTTRTTNQRCVHMLHVVLRVAQWVHCSRYAPGKGCVHRCVCWWVVKLGGLQPLGGAVCSVTTGHVLQHLRLWCFTSAAAVLLLLLHLVGAVITVALLVGR
jgi:hypothetical protein